jgi:hypothetical protein
MNIPSELWRNEIRAVLDAAAGLPDTTRDLAIVWAIGILAFLIVMRILAAATNNGNGGSLGNALLLAIGAVVVIGAAAAVRIYLFRDSLGTPAGLWGTRATALVALLLIVVPLMCLLQRVKYLTALLSIGLSVFAAGLIMSVSRAALDGLRGGRSVRQTMEEKSEAWEQMDQD